MVVPVRRSFGWPTVFTDERPRSRAYNSRKAPACKAVPTSKFSRERSSCVETRSCAPAILATNARIQPVRLLIDAPGARIEIGDDSRVNGAAIHAQSTITIGRHTYIASGTTILDVYGHAIDAHARASGERDQPLPVRIGDRTWIGLGVLILKGVEIGDDCVVAAGSIVSKSLPSATLCAGQPARPIRSLNTETP